MTFLITSSERKADTRHQRKLVAGLLSIIGMVCLIFILATRYSVSGQIELITALDNHEVLLKFASNKATQSNGYAMLVENEIAELQQLRGLLKMQTDNSVVAAKFSERALNIYRLTGDTRYFGYARGALTPWWDKEKPPAEIWLLRGRILQSDHQFEIAAFDLQNYVKTHKGSKEAHLLMADAWRRSGNIGMARQSCFALAIQGHPTVAKYCAVEIELSLGQFSNALKHGNELVSNMSSLSKSEKQWALSIVAEAATATGDHQLAARYYEQAIQNGETDIVLKSNYADVLLKLDREKEVLTILPESNSLAVLLRKSLALKNMNHKDNPYAEKLTRYFTDPFSNPDQYLIEQSKFQSLYLNDHNSGLKLAKQNWAEQKGWEDTDLLLALSKKHSPGEYANALKAVAEWRGLWLKQDAST